MTTTREQLDAVRSAIGDVVREHPTGVLMVIVDEIIETAIAGTNPALKDVMRLQFYRRVAERLRKLGVLD